MSNLSSKRKSRYLAAAPKGSAESSLERKPSRFNDIRRSVSLSTSNVKRQLSQKKSQVAGLMGIRKNHKKKQLDSLHQSEFSFDSHNNPNMFPQLRETWLGVSTEDCAKDLYRLIYRVNVTTSGQRSILMSPPPSEERGGNIHAANCANELIKLLAKRMLDPTEAQKICDLCDETILKVNDRTELVTHFVKLFKEIGADGKILRVLKCINQGVLAVPYGILRTELIKDKITRDVSGDHGWQIVITIAHEGFIQVVHKRREQSLDTATVTQRDKEKNHWEYTWEVSMTFDKNMIDMTQSRLSVTSLTTHGEMDPALREELCELLQNGNLIVF